MRSKSKLAKILALVSVMSLNFADASYACGPDYPQAVFFSWNHPDLPLRPFAGGNMGVIFDTWAKSYLCVAYRYLDGKPLNSAEQSSVDSMWVTRLKLGATYLSDPDFFSSLNYFDLREKVLHRKDSVEVFKVQSENHLTDGALRFALTTLKALIKGYGQNSPAVKQWVLAQDCVFGVNKKYKISVPAKLPIGSDKKLVVYRNYQIAAANLYLRNDEIAQAQFARLASDKTVPEIQKLSKYLEARAAAGEMFGASDVPHNIEKNMSRLEQYAKRTPDLQGKLDIIDLESMQISQNLLPEENLQRIVMSILRDAKKPQYALGDLGLGRDIWDLTYILDGGYIEIEKSELHKYDLVDWVDSVSSGSADFYMSIYANEEEAKAVKEKQDKQGHHSLEKFRSTHSKPWLVAALLACGLRGDDTRDVLAAAEELKPGDPAYLTARFYLIDRLIDQKKLAEARTELQKLNYNNMPLTSVNLFKAQQLATSLNLDTYFTAACMPVCAASSNLMLVDDARWHQWNTARKPLSAFDLEIGHDVDRYLPFEAWEKISHRSDLSSNLKQRILTAVWIKSHLLGKHIDETALLTQLKPLVSKSTSEKISKYQETTDATTKQFLFAQILLDNYGMSPYVESGLPRFADKIETFNYYHKNFWQPLIPQPTAKDLKDEQENPGWTSVSERMNLPIAQLLKQYYSTQKIDGLLSAQQVKEASAERVTMENQHPSKFLGNAVLKYAKAHPDDPDVPNYLFKIVKLPRWSGETEVGTEYSRKAYLTLHNRYPGNKWSKQATCYY